MPNRTHGTEPVVDPVVCGLCLFSPSDSTDHSCVCVCVRERENETIHLCVCGGTRRFLWVRVAVMCVMTHISNLEEHEENEDTGDE